MIKTDKKYFIALLLIGAAFGYGLLAGVFKIQPYGFFESAYYFMNPEIAKYGSPIEEKIKIDYDSMISVKGAKEATAKRNDLIRFVWKNKGFPGDIPQNIYRDFKDKRFSGMANLKRIDMINVTMDYNVNSVIYHFVPEKTNNKLILYHEGHDGDFGLGKKSIEFFLKKGYSVMAFSMPLIGMNNKPVVDIEKVGKIGRASCRERVCQYV